MVEPHVVTLRETRAGDLDELFRFRQDEEAARMAAFTPDDVADRSAFDARWERLSADPGVRMVTIRADGVVVGDAGRWTDPDEGPMITYWVDRAHWRRGIATRAMRLFLDAEPRPVRAHAAADNAASIAVLGKLGFVEVGRDRGYANARGAEIEEIVLELR
ncbi:GNAT family N-acetyltransferase [Agromyces sp. SYSU T0242]|uniref:GNAT family N-acetyltransferase n=1 Tax=Agromyces litoreus TaxID=3158561 RepID=UPI00339927C8